MVRPVVLILEGADGSGKSTSAVLIADELKARGIPLTHISLRGPNAPPPVRAFSDFMRACDLRPEHRPGGEASVLLRIARLYEVAQHLRLVKTPVVLVERFVASVAARARLDESCGVPHNDWSSMRQLLVNIWHRVSPDVTLLCRPPFEVARSRVLQRSTLSPMESLSDSTNRLLYEYLDTEVSDACFPGALEVLDTSRGLVEAREFILRVLDRWVPLGEG